MSTPERNTARLTLAFPRQARITRGAEIQRIAREGKRIRTRHLEVRAATSPLARTDQPLTAVCRVGFVVPRYAHTAVARNLVKRRLRELVRVYVLPTRIHADIIVRIRPDAYGASFDSLANEIQSIIGQLRNSFDSDAHGTQFKDVTAAI